MHSQIAGCFVEQSSHLGKGQHVFFTRNRAHLGMWKTALASLPCLQFNVGKSPVDCSYSPFCPQTLRVSLHAILEHCLYETMNAQRLQFGNASYKRVTQQ